MSENIANPEAREVRRVQRSMEDEKRMVALVHGHSFNDHKICRRCGLKAWDYYQQPTPKPLCHA